MAGPKPAPGTPAAFAVDPVEAIRFLREKLNVPTARWTDLWQAMHDRGFMVAGAQSDALLDDFHAAINRAIGAGTTLADFREEFDRIVAAHGWSYHGSRNWRSRVIFQTNMRTALAAGKWQQIQRLKAARPWLRYVGVLDERIRPEHRAWHDTVLSCDDPWWETHFPPNGWNCRCTVQQLNDRDLARYGLKVTEAPADELVTVNVRGKGPVTVPKGIDPGFAYNPGRSLAPPP